MTQAELARAAGTSQPTVAAYETGSKSPRLSTVERLAASVGKEAVVVFVTLLTREDRSSLAIHQAIALKLRHDPTTVLEMARTNLQRLVVQHPHANQPPGPGPTDDPHRRRQSDRLCRPDTITV